MGIINRYCVVPFTHLDLTPSGFKCCTWLNSFKGISPLRYFSESSWKSRAFEEIRETIKERNYQFCNLNRCSYLRDNKNFYTLEEIKELYPYIYSYIIGEDEIYKGKPEFINFGIYSTCNLRCPSCNGSKLPKLGKEESLEILKSIEIFKDSIKTVFIAGMGEPFFSPVYLDWIKSFKKIDFPALKNIEINTNALMLTEDLWYSLPEEFRSLISLFTVSIDGASIVTYEGNRRGGNYFTLKERLSFLKSLKLKNEIPLMRLYFVYQENNYHEIPRMVELAKEYSFDEIYFERMMDWGAMNPKEFEEKDVGRTDHKNYFNLKKIEREVKFKKIDGLKIVFFN